MDDVIWWLLNTKEGSDAVFDPEPWFISKKGEAMSTQPPEKEEK